MIIFELNKENLDAAIACASEILNNDGIIIYPTDTIYGISANLFSEKAYRNIYKLKGRRFNKAVTWQIKNSEYIENVLDKRNIPDRLNYKNFFKSVFPGPVTVVVHVLNHKLPEHLKNYTQIGFRIPDNLFCHQLSTAIDYPIASTSANLAEKPYLADIDHIIKTFKDRVDAIFIEKASSNIIGSTIIQLGVTGVRILREGLVTESEILKIYLSSCYN